MACLALLLALGCLPVLILALVGCKSPTRSSNLGMTNHQFPANNVSRFEDPSEVGS
jgi:hypothetical protein